MSARKQWQMTVHGVEHKEEKSEDVKYVRGHEKGAGSLKLGSWKERTRKAPGGDRRVRPGMEIIEKLQLLVMTGLERDHGSKWLRKRHRQSR